MASASATTDPNCRPGPRPPWPRSQRSGTRLKAKEPPVPHMGKASRHKRFIGSTQIRPISKGSGKPLHRNGLPDFLGSCIDRSKRGLGGSNMLSPPISIYATAFALTRSMVLRMLAQRERPEKTSTTLPLSVKGGSWRTDRSFISPLWTMYSTIWLNNRFASRPAPRHSGIPKRPPCPPRTARRR